MNWCEGNDVDYALEPACKARLVGVPGETSVAVRYGVSHRVRCQNNSLASDCIRADQVLDIPAS